MSEHTQETAIDFFYEHAGSSYRPGEETPDEGRRRGAKELAEAEVWGKSVGLVFDWSSDWEIPSHVKEYDAYDEEPSTCEMCAAILDGEVVASLSCIDDASSKDRRLVEAGLAAEVMADRTGPGGEARLYRMAKDKLLAAATALEEARGVLTTTAMGQTADEVGNAVTDTVNELEDEVKRIRTAASFVGFMADRFQRVANIENAAQPSEGT